MEVVGHGMMHIALKLVKLLLLAHLDLSRPVDQDGRGIASNMSSIAQLGHKFFIAP